MDITQANNIDLECLYRSFFSFSPSLVVEYRVLNVINKFIGACEGSLACSTCHVVVDPAYYEKLDEPTDEENDMLDLAFGLTETLVSKIENI
jgi:hypothetical protein